MNVEKAIFDCGIEHVLPNGWVEGIRDVDDGELDWGCHFFLSTSYLQYLEQLSEGSSIEGQEK